LKKGGIRDALVYTKITEIEESLKIVNDNLPDEVEEFVTLGLVKEEYNFLSKTNFYICIDIVTSGR